MQFMKRVMLLHLNIAYGLRFDYVEADGHSGITKHSSKQTIPDLKKKPGYPDPALAVSAGGPIAASICRYNNPYTWVWGDWMDFLELCWLEAYFEKLQAIGAPKIVPPDKLVEQLIKRTIGLIEDNWKVVEAVAAHLEQFKRVRFAQCIRIAQKVDSGFPRDSNPPE
jgi:hypothetical protein